jgi:hypothetical protein
MPYLELPAHISFAFVGDRAVFLDLRRDRYLALDAACGSAFRRVAGRSVCLGPDDPDVVRLLSTGLFMLGEDARPLEPAAATIPVAHPPPASARVNLFDIGRVWLLLSRARRALKSRPLEQVLADRRGRRSAGLAANDEKETEALAARFCRARALVPIRPSCLQDSLALSDFLAARSAFPSIVFGVKLDPFAAHCWVQSNRMVLNDAPDRIAEFTPILIVS